MDLDRAPAIMFPLTPGMMPGMQLLQPRARHMSIYLRGG
jgi:hypothetical protein